MPPTSSSALPHTHHHHDHEDGPVHGAVAAAPFPGTALLLGVGARIALAAGAAAVLWLTVGWALA